MCIQNFDDSRGFAIRKTYRISLRSSSLWEPRHPLLKGVLGVISTGNRRMSVISFKVKWFVLWLWNTNPGGGPCFRSGPIHCACKHAQLQKLNRMRVDTPGLWEKLAFYSESYSTCTGIECRTEWYRDRPHRKPVWLFSTPGSRGMGWCEASVW